MTEYKVYYDGQETSDFGTLARWFMEVYNKMRGLEEANRQLEKANNQYEDDMRRLKDGYYQFKIRNRSLESDIDILEEENSRLKTELEERKNDSKEVANCILKSALEFCQKEASSAREHAHNVEVNAERIRKGLD